MQYGVNIAVLDKARDGSWGKIAVRNATSLVSLEKKVNLAEAIPGWMLMYQLKVRNIESLRRSPSRSATQSPRTPPM